MPSKKGSAFNDGSYFKERKKYILNPVSILNLGIPYSKHLHENRICNLNLIF